LAIIPQISNMGYVIIQRELVVPELDQLKRAFTVLPILTDLDAQTVVNDAYGILLRGLSLEQASALQDALLKEKIETVVIEEAKLPAIPPARVIRQVELFPSHLTLYDPMRRASEVPWREILMMAAGQVRMREIRRIKSTLEEPQFRGVGVSYDTTSDVKSRDELREQLILEIFLASGNGRFTISGNEFAFDHLGQRLSNDLGINFVLLVQDLVQNAPHAGLNRGAFLACQEPPELFSYPSKQAFTEEIVWMLWRISRMNAESGGGPEPG
jgi:hypothetical protein